MKQVINPANLPEPVGHFDRAVRIGPWLYISGTSALTHLSGDIAARKLVPDIAMQVRATLRNIRTVCHTAGYELSDIYEIRFTLKNRDDFGITNDILKEFLPVKGFVAHGYQGEMLHPDMLIEIEANAYRATRGAEASEG